MEQLGESVLSVGDVVRHQRLGIGVVGDSGATDPIVHFYPKGFGRVARSRLELLERRESLLGMLDGTWHLGVERLQAAIVYLRLDVYALYRRAAIHFALCPEDTTRRFLLAYLRSEPRPPRINKMRARIREARDEADRLREEANRHRLVTLRLREDWYPAIPEVTYRMGEDKHQARPEATYRLRDEQYRARPEVKAATRRGQGESIEAHIARIDARLAELGAPTLTTGQRISMRRGYQNFCWNCDQGVVSEYSIPCPSCGWYVCRSCGRCKKSGQGPPCLPEIADL